MSSSAPESMARDTHLASSGRPHGASLFWQTLTLRQSSTQRSQQPRRARRLGWALGALLGLGGAGAAAWAALPAAGLPAAEPGASIATPLLARPLPADTIRAEASASYSVATAYTGELSARRRSQLGFELPGRVTELLVDEGDEVAAGQELARLDAHSLEAQRDQVAASVAELEAQLRLAEITLSRRQGERREGVAAAAAVDESLASRDALQARLQSTRARLRQLTIDVERSVLVAPFAGSIAQRYVDEGRVLQAGSPVLDIVESARLEARVGVPQPLVRELVTGSVHELEIGGTQRKARVKSILPIVDARTRTVTVLFALDEARGSRPGQSVRWIAEREIQARGFWLPTSALSKGTRGLWSCLVLLPGEESNRYVVERRELELLHTSGERSYVRGTLAAGDLVIRSGTHRFVAGQAAIPAEDATR
jgi:RND family efflux transporter MFP subunit